MALDNEELNKRREERAKCREQRQQRKEKLQLISLIVIAIFLVIAIVAVLVVYLGGFTPSLPQPGETQIQTQPPETTLPPETEPPQTEPQETLPPDTVIHVVAGGDLNITDKVVAALDGLKVELKYVDGVQRVFANGEDVSDLIRTPAISMAASAVSAIPAVRAYLLDTPRNIAASHSVIMDGRDIGTVILPDAKVKIFLSASPESRAKRRYDELQAKGDPATFEEVLADMIKRDYDDSHRAIAPLKQAEDAIPVDTSGETLEESVAKIKAIVYKKLAE